MRKFRCIFVFVFISVTRVWSGDSFELDFITWPNETQVVVNETVKFLWKYNVKGTDVDIKWGTSKHISPKVSTFDKIFFNAIEYEKYRNPVISPEIPARYRGRVQIVGQASLQIVNVTLEDEGEYLCEISDTGDAWKTLSRAAKLHVLVPPKIVSHPRDTQLLSEGEELKLGCKATGKPKPEVSWYKGYVELIQGTGSAEYLNLDVSRRDNGNYKCVARNNASQVEHTVQVIVQYKPVGTKIKTDAGIDTLEKGEDLKIVCEARSKPDPSFVLYHHSEAGLGREVVRVQNSSTGEFYIKNIKPSQRGNYSCIPYNDVGRGAEALVHVYVRFSPVIKKLSPTKLNLTKNEPLLISCDTEGYPLPKITWTDGNGKNIGSERVFKIRHVHESDQGVYTCAASNGILPSANKSVHIKVFYKPVIDSTRSSSGIAAQKGETVVLKCNATGNPLPSFKWQKGDLGTVGSKPTITIKISKPADFGRYSCVVSNSVGTTTHTVNVFEVDKPLIEDLKVTSLEPRSVHLTWKIGRSTKYPIEDQELVYFLEKSKKGEERIKLEGTKRSYKIHRLTPYSKYVVRLKVRNIFIPSDQKEISFTTATARPGPPGQPRVQFRHSTSVRVAWNPPKEANGELVRYVLEYSIANDSSSVKKIGTSASKMSLDVENLKRGLLYRFKVKATTSAGPGDFSKDSLFRMNFEAPSIPEPPNVTMPSANVYRLVWNKPNLAGNLAKVLVSLEWRIKHLGEIDQDEKEILVGKNVRSRTRRDITFDWKAEVKDYGSKRVLDLIGLFPNTIYKVSIKEGLEVKGEILWSAETSTEIVTPAGVPSQPRDLTVDMLSDASVLLSWKRPLYIGGKLKKYIVFYGTDNDEKKKELKSGLENENVTMVVDGITNKKKYDVQVQANGDKPGLMSNIVELKQGSGILKMSVDSQTKDSFTISWRKPSIPSIKIDDYRIYYRTVNGKWMSKDITSGLDNKTLSAKVNGLTSGELYQVKIQARSKRQVFLSEKQEVRSAIVQAREDDGTDYVPMFGGIIAGVLIFAFVIIIVAMFVRYNYRKRQRNQRRSGQVSRETPNVLITRENGHTHMSSPSDHLSSDSPGSEKYLRPERKGNSVQVPLKVLSESTKPIPVSNLLEYCTDHRQDGNKGFAEEFKSIDTGVNYSYEECKKPVNKSKNRYANIVTYDHTRVCLSNLGDNGSDYINANYVDGYNCQEKFIATQGPVASTFNDFWRMVWEQNCAAIVMVTNLIEKGKVKCQKYWPVTEAELFGSLTVNPIEEWELTDYTIRKFQLQQNNNSELTRDVTQFHYTAWPDHGVPVHPSRLLAFIRRVKNYFRVATGKILVHCSAGVGRTGTFIALDALLDQMKVEGVVDIYKFVSHMRTQRSLMVQTEAQYSFIYEAILEASICGDTEIPVPDYLEKLQILEQDDQDDFLSKEFQNLNIVSVDEKETCVSGLIPENQIKNRYSSILPYDSNRVKLWPYQNEIGSDYINASFIDGYRNREIFIATQAPVKESVEDFWRMIWEYECYVLIMLLNEREDDEFQFLQYWPSQGEEYITFGLLMIEVESEQESDSYVQRILKCTNTKSGEVRKIYHINFIGWADHGVPVSASSLLNFVKEIVKLEQRTGNGLTLVHCSDGSGRVGTFATIYIALERMKLESIIDVFSIVRNLRTQRIGMVENIEQYKFCYHALGEHIKSPNSQSY